MHKKVLIVDESCNDSKNLIDILEQNKFKVEFIEIKELWFERLKHTNFDLLITGKGRENIKGLKLCKDVREFSECPILMISDDNSIENKVLALNNGADDYVTKPFDNRELLARINSIIRRREACNKYFLEKSVIRIEDLEINTIGRVVNVGDKIINLTAKEFDLLILLATNRGEVYSRKVLLDKIWGYDEYFADVRTVDVHIRRLRKKIERDPSKPFYIITSWGAGYYFREE